MKKSRLLLSMGILLSGSFVADFSTDAKQPPSALTALRTKMKSAKTLEAQFTQEIQDSLFPGDEDKAEGSFSFERPDRLRWTYVKPEPRIIRYGNRKLEIEEKGHSETIDAQGSITLEAAFSFLWGETNRDLFIVEAKGANGVDMTTFVLKPRQKKEAQFREIEFRIKRGLVAEARVTTLTDAVSVLKFRDWKVK